VESDSKAFDPAEFRRILLSRFAVVFLPMLLLAIGLQLGGLSEMAPERMVSGWFAFGPTAIGLVAIGGLAIGGIAIGGMSIGVFAYGGGAIGIVAIGGGAVGLVALGGAALGLVSVGGGALGIYALGGGAFGRYRLSYAHQDRKAAEFFVQCVPALGRAFPRGTHAL